MRISKDQIAKLDAYFFDRFVRQTHKHFANSDITKLKSIVQEALEGGIDDEVLVVEYIKLYFDNLNYFENKPPWLVYVLNGDYSPEEKVEHMKKTLSTLYDEK